MERVELSGNSPYTRSGKGKKTEKKHSSRGIGFFEDRNEEYGDFSIFLDGSMTENVSLEDLLDDVHQAGEKLAEKPFMSSIMEYKKAVRKFMGYIVTRAYASESDIQVRKYIKNGMPMIDEKKWVKIKVVDEKLEKLALYIVQNQKSQLTILKKIEEIEGILVDLMG